MFQRVSLELHRCKHLMNLALQLVTWILLFQKLKHQLNLCSDFYSVFKIIIIIIISGIPSFFRDTYLSNVDQNRMSGYPRVSIRLDPRAVEALLQGKLGHLHINISERHLLYLICHCDVMRASLSLSTLRSAQQTCHSQWGSSAHNEPIRRRRVTACPDWLDVNGASPLAGIGITLWTKFLMGWSYK